MSSVTANQWKQVQRWPVRFCRLNTPLISNMPVKRFVVGINTVKIKTSHLSCRGRVSRRWSGWMVALQSPTGRGSGRGSGLDACRSVREQKRRCLGRGRRCLYFNHLLKWIKPQSFLWVARCETSSLWPFLFPRTRFFLTGTFHGSCDHWMSAPSVASLSFGWRSQLSLIFYYCFWCFPALMWSNSWRTYRWTNHGAPTFLKNTFL